MLLSYRITDGRDIRSGIELESIYRTHLILCRLLPSYGTHPYLDALYWELKQSKLLEIHNGSELKLSLLAVFDSEFFLD